MERIYSIYKNLFPIKFILLLAVLVSGLSANAQGGELYVFGVVKDYYTSSKLEGVTIAVLANGATVDQLVSKSNGKYEFFLEIGKEYTLSFSKSGMVSKKVLLDSRNIPEDEVMAGFSMNIEMTLFEEQEGLDTSILDKPIGKAKYDPTNATLEFDFAYTQQIQNEINKMMKDVEAMKKNKEKEAAEEAKRLAQLEADFKKSMDAGRKDMGSKNYASATTNFEKAVSLKPEDISANELLAEAKKLLKEQNAEAELEAQYGKLLDEADGFFRTEDFTDAVAKYRAALEVKPGEVYPKEQIIAAEKKIKENEEKAEKDAEFNALVAEGDAQVEAKSFMEGIKKYDQALSLRPSDKDVAIKKKAAQDLLKAEEEKAAKLDQYNELISSADELFDAGDYPSALKKYQSANTLLPDETYPPERISLVNEKLQEAEQAAQQEEQFRQLVLEGDQEVKKSQFEAAISKFTAALEIKSDDETVKQKLSAAREEYDKIKASEEADKLYTELIAEADGYFESNNYSSAREKYQEALSIKPQESHPANQLKAIEDALADEEKRKAEEERLAAEEAEREARFKEFMETGSTAMKDQEYENAIASFDKALEIKPDDSGAVSLREEAERKLNEFSEAREVDERYNDIIAQGDAKFREESFDEAISFYEKAVDLKPTEEYPQNQIAAIHEIIENRKKEEELAIQQKIDEEFNALVSEGDAFAKEKSWDEAISKYEDALTVKPGNSEVEQKISSLRNQMSEEMKEADRERRFNELVATADGLAAEQLLEEAVISYEEALEIKPGDAEVRSKIESLQQKIDQLLAEKELADQYSSIISKGERLLKEEEFEEAIVSFEEASGIKPEETYPKKKIEEINQLIVERDKRELDNNYKRLITEADQWLSSNQLDEAKSKYQEASGLKPEEKYPLQRIQEIDARMEAWLKEQEEIAARKAEEERIRQERIDRENAEIAYKDAIREGDNLFIEKNFQNALFSYERALKIKENETYPRSRIEKINQILAAMEEQEKERQRLATLQEEEENRKNNKSRNFARVRGNSEDEAEKFMREARLAEEAEKYERIKKQKSDLNETHQDYQKAADQTRAANMQDIDQHKVPLEEKFSAQVGLQDKRSKNMVRYKSALEKSKNKAQEDHHEDLAVHYEKITEENKELVDHLNERNNLSKEKAEITFEKNKAINEKRNKENNEDLEEVRQYGERIADFKEKQQEQNRKKSEEQAEKAKSSLEFKNEWEQEMQAKDQKSLDKVRENHTAILEQKEVIEKRAEAGNEIPLNNHEEIKNKQQQYAASDAASKQLAETRTQKAIINNQILSSSGNEKSVEDYHRTQLADEYPQGVTEESSTEGNKVIIRRIVVRGNKGDEYKKVVDKAGNYYFKNGRSISEVTWSRETVEAFD